MNLQELRYLVALADTRHFGRAAERCFVSQPTLSMQIKRLEDELGVALFERGNRTVGITPIGEAILARAQQILLQADNIRELARAHRDPLAGHLAVGVIPTLSPYLLPLILAPLQRDYPLLKLVLSEETTANLLARLRAHEIDAALLATAVDESGLDSWPLFLEPFWLAFPGSDPLSTRDEIGRADLEQVNLLLLAEGHCLARQAMEVCGIDDRNRAGDMADLRASSLETLLQLVAAGFGSTLVPALALRGTWTTDAGIHFRPIALAGAARTVVLAFRVGFPRRAALTALADVVLANLPNTVQPSSIRHARAV